MKVGSRPLAAGLIDVAFVRPVAHGEPAAGGAGLRIPERAPARRPNWQYQTKYRPKTGAKSIYAMGEHARNPRLTGLFIKNSRFLPLATKFFFLLFVSSTCEISQQYQSSVTEIAGYAFLSVLQREP
ncbi:hypothetical protein [Pandoraea sp. SD6-2]|uniref:hypothetical protein n=1 Tax=Pandoraea sp. SD6-2 TaxID=1286093 RepID=UPI001185DED6|nr:hypothetical protein [Pandoraea sp. SD6-2]